MHRLLSRKAGFTLVEMLVVVAIMGLLAGLLLPALARVRAASRKASCSSNLRQFGVALSIYAAEFGMNPLNDLTNLYPRYLADKGLYRCPSDRVQREDTYSLCYRGGHPALLEDDREVIMCPNHSGTPHGLFGDGRVSNVSRLKGGVLLTARLGSGTEPEGPEVEFPVESPGMGNIWYTANGEWQLLRLRNAFISGIFETSEGTAIEGGLLGQREYQRLSSSNPSVIPINFDILGSEGRFIGENTFPGVTFGTMTGNPNHFSFGSYRFDIAESYEIYGRSFWTEKSQVSLMMHARPRAFRQSGVLYREFWPGPPEGTIEVEGTKGRPKGFHVGKNGLVSKTWVIPDVEHGEHIVHFGWASRPQ